MVRLVSSDEVPDNRKQDDCSKNDGRPVEAIRSDGRIDWPERPELRRILAFAERIIRSF